MIQRIQSLYLLAASIATALVSFKIPVLTVNNQLFMAQDDTKLFILTVATTILSFAGIFMFKKRKLQMKLIRLAILLLFVIGVRLFMLISEFDISLNTSCWALLALTFACLLLAYKGVKKDDDLVRSVDRIR